MESPLLAGHGCVHVCVRACVPQRAVPASRISSQKVVLRRITRVYDAEGNEHVTVDLIRSKAEVDKYITDKAEKLTQRCVAVVSPCHQ